jgi:hypothetical protein
MSRKAQHPFESIESAHEFVELLAESIQEALAEVREHLNIAKAAPKSIQADRRVEALTLTVYKMENLASHTTKSRRLLNDLRTLRRLLFSERGESAEE